MSLCFDYRSMLDQVKHKYSTMMVDVFRETFCYMPLAYVLKQKAISPYTTLK